ncbi:MAG: cytochrome b/b6 domain-containing protein [Chloroflexota bacterium]
MSNSTPERHHPLLVILHWLMALFIFAALAAGIFLKGLPNTPSKLAPLDIHMTLGTLILFLMIARLFTRYMTKRPSTVESGSLLLNKLAGLVHALLYITVISMAIAGMEISSQAGLNTPGASLPVDFFAFPARYGHKYIAIFLMVLISIHVAAWAYHQFVMKDNLISRMWFGKRK